MSQNRYDKLSEKARSFQRVRTESVSVSANDRTLVANADDPAWSGENEPFANYAPFNTITVENEGSTTVRVYLRSDRDLWFDVQPGESRRLEEPLYFSYVTAEEQEGSDNNDLTFTYGRTVKARELRFLEMSGQLDIRE